MNNDLMQQCIVAASLVIERGKDEKRVDWEVRFDWYVDYVYAAYMND